MFAMIQLSTASGILHSESIIPNLVGRDAMVRKILIGAFSALLPQVLRGQAWVFKMASKNDHAAEAHLCPRRI
jgi:hypothetical protein